VIAVLDLPLELISAPASLEVVWRFGADLVVRVERGSIGSATTPRTSQAEEASQSAPTAGLRAHRLIGSSAHPTGSSVHGVWVACHDARPLTDRAP
jgi:hypothetical protein